ncbi:MAG: prepilin peptidase [Thermoleophilaceae bacterium]|jgi:leader peptidase (prepilin peptidase)/N-methyltransferase
MLPPLLAVPFFALLAAAAAFDLKLRIVPNRLVAPAALWALAATAILAPAEVADRALAGALAFAAMLAPALARPGALGMGDVKLAGAMGLYLGVLVIPALLVAFVAGSAAGSAMLLRDGRSARHAALPFAPFLALGGVVGMVWGRELIGLYLDRLR